MLALALLLASSPAPQTSVARRGAVELEWIAPDDVCPDADAVIDDALALLGDAPPPELALRVVATVTTGDGPALTLRIGDAAAERHLRASDCGELARAAALLTAMAIDPTVASRMPDEPHAPDPPPPVSVEPELAAAVIAPTPTRPVVVRAAPPKPVKRRALHASAAIGAGVGGFALPRPTAALELGFALVIDRARIELAGSWWTPVARASPRNDAIGGRFQLGAATVRGCFVPVWRTLEFPLCGALHAGVMVGRGTGLPEPLSARAAWIGLGGGPMLLWRPRRPGGRLGVWVRAEGVGALTRPAFATAPSGLLWRARQGALVALAGIELRFWSRR